LSGSKSFAPSWSSRAVVAFVFAPPRRLIGRGENRDEFVDFSEKWLNVLRLDERAAVQVLEPVLALVDFFKDCPELGRELRM
jgi:hypothetical protein